MTLIRLTYNCDPESLNGISHEAFVDALENEFRLDPAHRECDLSVTFLSGESRVSVIATDGDLDHAGYLMLDETMRRLGEEAFRVCCRSCVGVIT